MSYEYTLQRPTPKTYVAEIYANDQGEDEKPIAISPTFDDVLAAEDWALDYIKTL